MTIKNSDSALKILHVEDNRVDAMLIKAMLEKIDSQDFLIDNRTSLEDVKTASADHDIILLDLSLPDSQDMQTLKQVRSFFPNLPIVILSGNDCSEPINSAISHGAQDYMVKGQITPEILTRTMRFAIERKRMEQALHESQERFRLAVDGSNDGIWDWPDVSKDYEYWSPRFKELLGYEYDEIEASFDNFLKLLHPGDLGLVDEAVNLHFVDNIPFDIEYRLQMKSGEYRWFHARGNTTRDKEGKPVRMTGSISDINDRKKDEFTLNRLYEIVSDQSLLLNEKISEILKSSFDYLQVSSAIVSHVKDENYKVLCFESTLEGADVNYFTKLDKELSIRSIKDEEVLTSLNTLGSANLQLSNIVEGANIDTYIGVAFNVNGKPYGSVGFYDEHVRPVSFKQREKNFIRLVSRWIASEIEHDKYLKTQKNLEQARRLEAVGQLTAGIAHEINTPMQFIGGNLRFTQESLAQLKSIFDIVCKFSNVDPESGENIQKELQFLRSKVDIDFLLNEIPLAIQQSLDGVDRVKRIVKAMKGSAHPDNIEMRLTNLNEEIRNACILSRSEWKLVAEVETEFDENLPMVMCLPYEINQVVLNIVINASHAISDVIDNGTYDKGLITIKTQGTSDFAEIIIQDNGMGMPNEVRQKIFDPFFTTKEVGVGTGQGLSLAYQVIKDKHKGDISVDSQPGKGTVFTIKIPMIVEDINQKCI